MKANEKPPREIPVLRDCSTTQQTQPSPELFPVLVIESPDPIKDITPQPIVRSLKIEADGDRWKGIKPKIRLVGHWLERAGFQPGNRVTVTCVARGVIELRSTDDPPPHNSDCAH